MPNASVAAAASGLPTPSRRALLAGSAAALAAPLAPAIAIEMSVLGELIADYRWAKAAEDALEETYRALVAVTVLPEVVVRYGKRRFQDPETRAITWGQWEFRYAFEVKHHFDPVLAAWSVDTVFPHHTERLHAERAACLAEIERQEALYERAEQTSGLTAAAAACNRAGDEVLRLCDEIFAYRPTTIAEVATKNAFLLQLHRERFNFADHLETIFGNGNPKS